MQQIKAMNKPRSRLGDGPSYFGDLKLTAQGQTHGRSVCAANHPDRRLKDAWGLSDSISSTCLAAGVGPFDLCSLFLPRRLVWVLLAMASWMLSSILLVGVPSNGLALDLRSSHRSLAILTTDMVGKTKEMGPITNRLDDAITNGKVELGGSLECYCSAKFTVSMYCIYVL